MAVKSNDWRNYALLIVALGCIGYWSYRRMSQAVRFQGLYADSMLRLAGRRLQPGYRINPVLAGDGAEDSGSLPDIPSFIPPESEITVTPREPGKRLADVVTISYSTWGFCHEPGINFSAYPVGVGLDFKFFYWQRWGLLVGVGYFKVPKEILSPQVALSRRIGSKGWFENTEVAAGYLPIGDVPIWGGIRVNF